MASLRACGADMVAHWYQSNAQLCSSFKHDMRWLSCVCGAPSTRSNFPAPTSSSEKDSCLASGSTGEAATQTARLAIPFISTALCTFHPTTIAFFIETTGNNDTRRLIFVSTVQALCEMSSRSARTRPTYKRLLFDFVNHRCIRWSQHTCVDGGIAISAFTLNSKQAYISSLCRHPISPRPWSPKAVLTRWALLRLLETPIAIFAHLP